MLADRLWHRADPSPAPDQRAADRLDLSRALEELPPEQRAALLLVYGHGFDYRSAAEVLGVAPGTIGSRLHRARAALRDLLGENEVHHPEKGGTR